VDLAELWEALGEGFREILPENPAASHAQAAVANGKISACVLDERVNVFGDELRDRVGVDEAGTGAGVAALAEELAGFVDEDEVGLCAAAVNSETEGVWGSGVLGHVVSDGGLKEKCWLVPLEGYAGCLERRCL